MRCSVSPSASWKSWPRWRSPARSQPALVILDMRDRPSLPPTIAMLRRQHPTTGVVIVAAALEPALMLEAMRAGVTEFLTAPVTAPDLQRRDHARHGVRPLRARAARCSRSSAPRAVSGRRRSRPTSRPRWRSLPAARRSSSTCTWPTATPPCTSEPSRGSRCIDALENVHRLDKAFLGGLVGHARGGLSLLASSDRRERDAGGLHERPYAHRVGGASTTATSCSTCRAPTS